jgi:hypothetical protein
MYIHYSSCAICILIHKTKHLFVLPNTQHPSVSPYLSVLRVSPKAIASATISVRANKPFHKTYKSYKSYENIA